MWSANTLIQQECIQLLKSDIRDIYNVKYLYFKYVRIVLNTKLVY